MLLPDGCDARLCSLEDGIKGGASNTFKEGFEDTQRLGDVLLGCRIVDEGYKEKFLNRRGGVKGLGKA